MQDGLNSPCLDLQEGFSGGKRLMKGIGIALGSVGLGGLPTRLRLFSPGRHCCRQGLRVGDALCQWLGSGNGAELWEPRDGSEGEPGTPASTASTTTGVTSPPCWPPRNSCLPEQAASGTSTEGAKAPTGRGSHRGDVGWGQNRGSWVAAAPWGGQDVSGSPGFGGSRVRLYAWVCACPHACAGPPGRGVCHHNLGPPPGPRQG